MAEEKRHYRLGVFVLVTVFLLAGILFVLGGRSLFQPTFTFETYFDTSVAGLGIGAPVNFRGVPLGEVTEIVTSAAEYERGVPLDKRKGYIVVRAKVTVSKAQREQIATEAAEMVKLGLRAQTQLAGITGQQYLALDFLDPKKYPATALSFDWTPKYEYVPSAPSLTGEIIANAQAFLASLNEAKIQDLSHNLNTLIVDVDKKVNEIPIAELSADAKNVLTNADATIKRIDKILAAAPIDDMFRKLDSASGHLDTLLADPGLKRSVDNLAAFTDDLRKLGESGELNRLVKSMDDLAGRLDALVGDNQYDVRVIIQDLRVTADNLRTLSETVKRYPAGALVGGPPDRIQIPGSTK